MHLCTYVVKKLLAPPPQQYQAEIRRNQRRFALKRFSGFQRNFSVFQREIFICRILEIPYL